MVKNPQLSMLGTQVQSLVRKIRSHLLCGRKTKKKKKKREKATAMGSQREMGELWRSEFAFCR